MATIGRKIGLGVEVIVPDFVRQTSIEWAVCRPQLFDWLLSEAHCDAYSICRQDRAQIVEILRAQVSVDVENDIFLGPVNANEAIRVFKILYDDFIVGLEEFYRFSLTSSFIQSDQYAELIDANSVFRRQLNHPFFEALVIQLDDFYRRLVTDLLISPIDEGYLLLEERKIPRKRDIDDFLAREDFYETASDVLRGELNILPDPRCLSEAVEFGHSAPVRRLRMVLAEWFYACGTNSDAIEARARRDFAKATADLRTLRTIRDFKESPIVFTAKTILGQVPVLGNVVGAADALIWLYERNIERRSCWAGIRHSQ